MYAFQKWMGTRFSTHSSTALPYTQYTVLTRIYTVHIDSGMHTYIALHVYLHVPHWYAFNPEAVDIIAKVLAIIAIGGYSFLKEHSMELL